MCLTNDVIGNEMTFWNYKISINLVFHKKNNLKDPYAQFKQVFVNKGVKFLV